MKFGYDLALYKDFGAKVSITLDLSSHCHTLVTGSSGSGKSQALLYLLGSLLKSASNTIVFLCDFKNSTDFRFLQTYPHYYSGLDCYKGIMEYYERFQQVRQNDTSNSSYLLIVDEYPALLSHLETLDKVNKTKHTNDILSAISVILMMGRGTGNGFGFWCVTQRADSSWFNSGSRDNFMSIIILGRVSREQKIMLLRGEDIPDRIYKPGQGILLTDGEPLKEVIYPLIRDMNNWKQHILAILSQSSGA